MNASHTKKAFIATLPKRYLDKKFTIQVLSTYLSDLLGGWSQVTTLNNCKVSDIPFDYFDNSNHVIYICELNLEFKLCDLEKEEETKEDSEILIDLLKEEGFKATVHPHPRRDILIKTQSGKIVITKSRKHGYLVDYIGKSNESFSVRGLNTYEDVIKCLNNEFYKSQA